MLAAMLKKANCHALTRKFTGVSRTFGRVYTSRPGTTVSGLHFRRAEQTDSYNRATKRNGPRVKPVRWPTKRHLALPCSLSTCPPPDSQPDQVFLADLSPSLLTGAAMGTGSARTMTADPEVQLRRPRRCNWCRVAQEAIERCAGLGLDRSLGRSAGVKANSHRCSGVRACVRACVDANQRVDQRELFRPDQHDVCVR